MRPGDATQVIQTIADARKAAEPYRQLRAAVGDVRLVGGLFVILGLLPMGLSVFSMFGRGDSWGARLLAIVNTIVLLGPSHRMPVTKAAVYSSGGFATPLGRSAVNAALGAELLNDPRFRADTWTHAEEHSLEVPLPFLQRVAPKSKILPIAVNDTDPKFVAQAGKALGELIKRKGVLLVISSDLSHYPSRETAWASNRSTTRLPAGGCSSRPRSRPCSSIPRWIATSTRPRSTTTSRS